MKKKLISSILSAAMAASLLTAPISAADTTETISYNYLYTSATGYTDDNVHTRQMEKLDRGLVAIKTSSGVYLSWRLWDSEDARFGSAQSNVSFNIYRGTQKITATPVANKTNYVDTSGTETSTYSVAPVIDGVEGELCEAVTVMANSYFDIPLTKPATETVVYPDGTTSATYSFFPADCSTGDLDGDGEYEIIIKWTSNEKDVGSPGDPSYSGTVRFSAYKLDGTKLWDNDINLGRNVYSSAHTVQFLVYDFNGDGKAEMMCQTSLGSKDAAGNYVSKAADPTENADIYNITDEENETADYRSYIIVDGEEFLTVFNGETGVAMDTIPLPTQREVTPGDKGVSFGDDSGNRSNRFVADVAYLDGEKPYAVYLRGYYFGRNGRQRTSIAGISFDGERLYPDYRFDTEEGMPGYYEGAEIYVGNGNHNCTVADVDNDGKDEFITGALCMEVDDANEFRPRWCTFMEHGDALHIGDYDPTHAGFEFFTVHEDAGPNTWSGETVTINFGMSVIDADNGDIMLHVEGSDDTGRGLMANLGIGGFYQVGSARTASYQSNGGTDFTQINTSPGANFRVFWDGDLYDEGLDGTTVSDWTGSKVSTYFNAGNYGVTKINGTKSNPALQADLFGDWREELVYPTTDGTALRVFTTTDETEYKIKTLMHDPVYRSGVAAQQTAYNQPPHVGMYLGEEVFAPDVKELKIMAKPSNTTYALGDEIDTTGMVVRADYVDGTYETIDVYDISGYDANKVGEQTVTVSYQGKTAEFTVTVKDITGISITTLPDKTVYAQEEELDTAGMVVTASFDGNLTRTVSDYTVSGYNANTIGEQTVTVSYLGQTATFTVIVKAVSGIEVVPPSKTVYTLGQALDVSDMIVYAIYEDGSKKELTSDNYIRSGYRSSVLGEQTVTIAYMGFKDTFTVTVNPASIVGMNGTYTNSSTESTTTEVPIGSYSGTFVLEHTIKINTMPANGDQDKNSTNGFLVKFMPQVTDRVGVGAGWYMTANGTDKANILWKADGRRATSVSKTALTIGQEYTFKYTFTNVGTGDGATVKMEIFDANGTSMGSAEGLSLRNMTSSNMHKGLPLTYLNIYNQANSGSTSSVTFDNAKVYAANEITNVDTSTKKVTVNLAGVITNSSLIAAQYDTFGALIGLEMLTAPDTLGESTVDMTIDADKVFFWSDMTPMDVWSK